WHKADNLAEFTDGTTTWINGPNGLVSRPNGECFPWESCVAAVAAPTPPLVPVAAPTAEVTVYRDVPYGPPDGAFHLLDVYVPGGVGPFPSVLVIHGGGFVGQGKELWAAEARRVAGAGFVAFVVN